MGKILQKKYGMVLYVICYMLYVICYIVCIVITLFILHKQC